MVADRAQPTVVVTGDITFDWNVADTTPASRSEARSQEQHASISVEPGGACLSEGLAAAVMEICGRFERARYRARTIGDFITRLRPGPPSSPSTTGSSRPRALGPDDGGRAHRAVPIRTAAPPRTGIACGQRIGARQGQAHRAGNPGATSICGPPYCPDPRVSSANRE